MRLEIKVMMKRGRREADAPNMEKFSAVYDLYKRGIINQEEAGKLFGVSVYLWRKWMERYGHLVDK